MTSLSGLINEFFDVLKTRFYAVDLSQSFSELRVSEKVPFTYDLLESENYFPKIETKSSKSVSRAIEYRNFGNDAFYKKKDIEALKFYIRSVAYAPLASTELALAYANRSAVLLKLGKYKSCLLDINRALKNNYPDSLKQKLLDRKNSCKLKLQTQRDLHSSVVDSVSDLHLNDNTSGDATIRKLDKYDVDFDATEINFDHKFKLPKANLNNLLIPNASAKIKIHFTPEMGRHLIATEDIESGEILAIENPYASILLPNFNYSHCSFCYVRSESLIPCEECSLIMFCSERCRDNASSLFHKTECQILATILSLEVGEMEWLAFRTLMVASKQGRELKTLMSHPLFRFPITGKYCSLNEKYVSEDYITVHNLEDNFTKRCASDVFHKSVAVSFLLHLLKHTTFFNQTNDEDEQSTYPELTDSESFAGMLLLKYLFNALSNAHEVSELVEKKRSCDSKTISDNLGIGAGLYPFHSLTNHSCDPNVVRHNHKDVIVSRSIQPIKAGDQLFDNYGYHYATHPREERHNHLGLQYFFECCCDPCKFDWPLHENLPSRIPEIISYNLISVHKLNEYSATFKKKLETLTNGYDDDQLDFMCKYLSLLHQSTKRPSKKYNECQECIKQILATRANYYKIPSDCVLLKL